MYLSRLALNMDNLNARRALADPYRMHQLVWSGFPQIQRQDRNEPSGILFRVEPIVQENPIVVLVQSAIRPDWRPLLGEGVVLSSKHAEYSPAFTSGQTLRFRLRANPTARRKLNEDGSPLGKRVGLFGEEKQRAWFERKAGDGGFELVEYRISRSGNLDSKKPENKEIRHLGVDFDGILRVTNSEQFEMTVTGGVGAGKGFGFGLLSIAPVR